MLLRIDAVRLTITSTQAARVALGSIYDRAENSPLRKITEQCADRADSVAIASSTAPSSDTDHKQSHHSHNERRQRTQPQLMRAKHIAIASLSPRSKQIIAPYPDRLTQRSHHASVSTIRRQQSHHSINAEHRADDKKHHNHQASPSCSRFVTETIATETRANPRDNILENTHRTDHRAIQTAQKERQHNQRNDDRHIEGKYCRKKLNLSQPTEVTRGRATDI